jgi:O-methyltransferase
MVAPWLGNFKASVQRLSRRIGYEIHRIPQASETGYETVRPVATYAPWHADKAFARTYAQIQSCTLVDRYRCFELWQLVEQTQSLRGALLEVGVWRGGTGALIASHAKQSGISDPVYLCDTFKGVVKVGPEDSQYANGEHSDTSVRAVEGLLSKLGLDNATILEGIFPDDTAHKIEAERFRFCHVDVDVYQSAKGITEWVWPRLVVGGIVVFDDYGFQSCDGVTRYVNELRNQPGRVVMHNLNGHAVVIKIA